MNLRLKNTSLFLFIVMGMTGMTIIFSRFMFTKDVYYRTYGDQLDFYRIDQLFSFQNKTEWIVYLLIPLILLVKTVLVSMCIQIGLLINDLKLSFGKTIQLVLTSEFVFFLPQLIKIAWFLFFVKNYTIVEVQQFYPLSALNIFDIDHLPAFMIYPFQTFNVFEILYWVLLAGGLKQALNKDLDNGIKIVFSGYIPALILWLLCVAFLTISFLPSAKI